MMILLGLLVVLAIPPSALAVVGWMALSAEDEPQSHI
jgi:hypothetical protein